MIPVDCDIVHIYSEISRMTTKKLKKAINQKGITNNVQVTRGKQENEKRNKDRENNKISDLGLNGSIITLHVNG